MRFRGDDALLSMDVVRPDSYVVTVTDGGYAKRTPVDDWTPKGRGILGVRAMRLVEDRGALVGAVVCDLTDQIFAVANDGVVIRTNVEGIRSSGRDTMGVRLMNLGADRSLVAVARAGESEEDEELDSDEVAPEGDTVSEGDESVTMAQTDAEVSDEDPSAG